MIHDADDTLSRLLASELVRIPGCPVRDPEQITFDPPTVVEAMQDGEARVNLFLYDVREDLQRRDESLRRLPGARPDQPVGVKRAPARLNLSYLVSAHAGDHPHTEHRLLSDVLGVLLRWPAVGDEYLSGSLSGAPGNTVLLTVSQPEHLTANDPKGLWQALGGRLRPTLSLVLNAPFDPFETTWKKTVREAVLTMGPGTDPNVPRDDLKSSGPRLSAAGIVADQVTAAPLEGVSVTLDGLMGNTYTDARGFFFLLNLQPGAYTLRLTHAGYQEQEVPLEVTAVGRADQLEPVVVALRPRTPRAAASADNE